MNFTWHEFAGSFIDAIRTGAGGNLLRHSLTVGCALWALERDDPAGPRPLLMTMEDGAGFQGAAFMLPPRKLLLQCPAHAAPQAAREIHARGWSLTAAHVNREAADAFTGAWCGLAGRTAMPSVVERLLVLHAVRTDARSPGAMRKAVLEDVERLTAWLLEFYQEALPEEAISVETARENTVSSIVDGTRYVWENDGPVSMALIARWVLDGVWITGVYTPPGHRRCGYAGSCVAELSARCLAEGASHCFLFSDAANPTSNSVYGKIGYVPLGDFGNYEFHALEA